MKGVAIGYVVALLLGIGVIALVGVWFATSGGKLGGQGSKTICDNKFLEYCVKNPNGQYNDFQAQVRDCINIPGSYDLCIHLLGTCKKIGEKVKFCVECCTRSCREDGDLDTCIAD